MDWFKDKPKLPENSVLLERVAARHNSPLIINGTAYLLSTWPSTFLPAYGGFAQDTCTLVPQSHSSKKVLLLGQPVGTILGL